jgi:hypothetical protein
LPGSGGIIARRGDCFQGHVAALLDRPLVVLFEEDCAEETGDGFLVGEDTNDFGSAIDLTVDAFERIGGMQLGSMLAGKLICALRP